MNKLIYLSFLLFLNITYSNDFKSFDEILNDLYRQEYRINIRKYIKIENKNGDIFNLYSLANNKKYKLFYVVSNKNLKDKNFISNKFFLYDIENKKYHSVTGKIKVNLKTINKYLITISFNKNFKEEIQIFDNKLNLKYIIYKQSGIITYLKIKNEIKNIWSIEFSKTIDSDNLFDKNIFDFIKLEKLNYKSHLSNFYFKIDDILEFLEIPSLKLFLLDENDKLSNLIYTKEFVKGKIKYKFEKEIENVKFIIPDKNSKFITTFYNDKNIKQLLNEVIEFIEFEIDNNKYTLKNIELNENNHYWMIELKFSKFTLFKSINIFFEKDKISYNTDFDVYLKNNFDNKLYFLYPNDILNISISEKEYIKLLTSFSNIFKGTCIDRLTQMSYNLYQIEGMKNLLFEICKECEGF